MRDLDAIMGRVTPSHPIGSILPRHAVQSELWPCGTGGGWGGHREGPVTRRPTHKAGFPRLLAVKWRPGFRLGQPGSLQVPTPGSPAEQRVSPPSASWGEEPALRLQELSAPPGLPSLGGSWAWECA